jgi:hypothetical protein
MPLVVKFADAKIGDGGAGAGNMNMKRPFNDASGAGLSNKKQFNGMMGGFNGYNMGMSSGYDMSGMGMVRLPSNALAFHALLLTLDPLLSHAVTYGHGRDGIWYGDESDGIDDGGHGKPTLFQS